MVAFHQILEVRLDRCFDLPLRHYDHAQTSYRAREVIIRKLPDGEPRRDEIASELRLSERTLQRRLQEEATSFVQLLDETRRELAEQYLGRLQLSLAQAAYLLGSSDQRSSSAPANAGSRSRPVNIEAGCTDSR